MELLWRHFEILGSAALAGGIIGLERELRGEWAGLRTHMIVTIASAMFLHSGMMADGITSADLSRIIQGVAAGIGFIGAGTILKLTGRREVHGLTTASSIWLAGAIGVACGLRQYALAAVAVVLTVFTLAALRSIEAWLPPRHNHLDAVETKDASSTSPHEKS